MRTKARGKATPEEIARRDADERQEIENELALRDVRLRVREVAESLARVRKWIAGKLGEPLTMTDLRALEEAEKHYARLCDRVERRI